jgi:hypothetical protein
MKLPDVGVAAADEQAGFTTSAAGRCESAAGEILIAGSEARV